MAPILAFQLGFVSDNAATRKSRICIGLAIQNDVFGPFARAPDSGK